ncbi:MAG: HDIG domain-containing protein [Candidatus Diapherotrites archaeon]|nr:HDIG domain-containing protein [Candidatus Diapherotrites archaeon]
MKTDLVPSEEECLKLLKLQNVPENIIRHSIKVKELAIEICNSLKDRGIKINEKLVVAGALLHDLDKAETLDSEKKGHGKVAAEELEKLGMKSVSEIVRKHLLENILYGELKTIEEKIIFYADKRVQDDKLVSLDERFKYFKERYGLKDSSIMKIICESYPKVVELEKELIGWRKSSS